MPNIIIKSDARRAAEAACLREHTDGQPTAQNREYAEQIADVFQETAREIVRIRDKEGSK